MKPVFCSYLSRLFLLVLRPLEYVRDHLHCMARRSFHHALPRFPFMQTHTHTPTHARSSSSSSNDLFYSVSFTFNRCFGLASSSPSFSSSSTPSASTSFYSFLPFGLHSFPLNNKIIPYLYTHTYTRLYSRILCAHSCGVFPPFTWAPMWEWACCAAHVFDILSLGERLTQIHMHLPHTRSLAQRSTRLVYNATDSHPIPVR